MNNSPNLNDITIKTHVVVEKLLDAMISFGALGVEVRTIPEGGLFAIKMDNESDSKSLMFMMLVDKCDEELLPIITKNAYKIITEMLNEINSFEPTDIASETEPTSGIIKVLMKNKECAQEMSFLIQVVKETDSFNLETLITTCSPRQSLTNDKFNDYSLN